MNPSLLPPRIPSSGSAALAVERGQSRESKNPRPRLYECPRRHSPYKPARQTSAGVVEVRSQDDKHRHHQDHPGPEPHGPCSMRQLNIFKHDSDQTSRHAHAIRSYSIWYLSRRQAPASLCFRSGDGHAAPAELGGIRINSDSDSPTNSNQIKTHAALRHTAFIFLDHKNSDVMSDATDLRSTLTSLPTAQPTMPLQPPRSPSSPTAFPTKQLQPSLPL